MSGAHSMPPLWHGHVVGHDTGVCWGAGWHGDGDRQLAHLQSYGILDWISSTSHPPVGRWLPCPSRPPLLTLGARGPVLTDCFTPLKCRGNPIWAGSAKLLHSRPAHRDLISQLHADDCNWMNSLAGCQGSRERRFGEGHWAPGMKTNREITRGRDEDERGDEEMRGGWALSQWPIRRREPDRGKGKTGRLSDRGHNTSAWSRIRLNLPQLEPKETGLCATSTLHGSNFFS